MATSKAQRQATAERRARCVAMRPEGHEWHDIAATLGYAGPAAACKDYPREMDATRAELVEQTELMRTEATSRLKAMRREVWKVLRREHVTVSHGKVVQKVVGWELDEDGQERRDADGHRIPVMEDLLDDAPVLQAVDRLVKIEDQLAKLLGVCGAGHAGDGGPGTVQHRGRGPGGAAVNDEPAGELARAPEQVHGMYLAAAAEALNRITASGLRSSLGHQALAQVDLLYASAIACKVALGQILRLGHGRP